MKSTRTSAAVSYVFSYSSAAVFLIPVYILVNLAFRPVDDLSSGILPTTHPTLANLAQAWTESALPTSIVGSFIVTSVSCIAILVFSTMAAYPLARSTARLSSATFYLFLIGLLLPFQVAMLPLYVTMKDLGLLGSIWSLVLLYAGSQMPFSIFIVTTFLRAVPLEFEEAARIDGCSNFKAFVLVVVPLLRPVLGTVVILSAVGIWNDFFTPLLYLVGGDLQTIPLAIYSFVGIYATQWPTVFAALIISMIPILALYLVFQRFVVAGFAGGLKG